MCDIDAATDGNARGRLAHHFRQYAAELGAADEYVVRPFDAGGEFRPQRNDRVMHGKSGDKAHLRRSLRAFGDGEQEGGVEIAGFAHPVAPETTPPERLLIRHKPERPAIPVLGEPAGLQISGIDPVEMADRMSCRQDQ